MQSENKQILFFLRIYQKFEESANAAVKIV